ncbi:prepilin-type N-terminal cleavage/methylation domain-containing protein [Candidatus Berkelbacteria bacterium]|nr:prepilin-type N-terminal cleavage/methylation domain-containing protein [Candidatus Berkelbacteria bacterium]
MKKGYTIIELLVVISIAGILMSLGAYSWNSVASRSRDNTRKTDLERIKTVLEQYASDNRSYPKVNTDSGMKLVAEYQLNNSCTGSTEDSRLYPKYIAIIPTDPKKKIENCSDVTVTDQHGYYLYLSSGDPSQQGNATGYALMATLEKETDRISDNNNPLKNGSNLLNYSVYKNNESAFDQNYIIFGGLNRSSN